MFNRLYFCNNGSISLLDIISMGDSSKRGDSSKHGTFDSGLKYAIALLLRNGLDIVIYDRKETYTFSTKEVTEGHKTKELITVTTSSDNKEHVTGFAKNLGFNWELWMAFRELYSNMLDERGKMYLEDSNNNHSKFHDFDICVSVQVPQEILDEWSKYFISDSDRVVISNGSVTCFENSSGHLKLYKNGILIFEDEDTPALYKYDYKHASIDERRVLNKQGDFDYEVGRMISTTTDESFIVNMLTEVSNGNNYYEGGLNYSYLNRTWITEANKIHERGESFNTIPSLFDEISKHEDAKVGVRMLQQSNQWFAPTYKVVEVPKTESFEERISNIVSKYDIDSSLFTIKESSIERVNVLSDVHNKIIFVSTEFDEKISMWEFVKAYLRIKYNNDDNAVFKELTEKLKNEI